MAYHGYIPHIKKFLTSIDAPKVLEIGLDKGITTIPLITFLIRAHRNFEFIGVDILLQESLVTILNNIDYLEGQKVKLSQENSMEFLPKLSESGQKFDVILVDGDHNYHTVKNELRYLDDISKSNTVVIIDDYHGRWSDKDMWYKERPGYENVSVATNPLMTEKQGVKSAVDEFLEQNSNWFLSCPIKGEPIVLTKRKL
jgi:hypothetical protein